MQDTQNQLYDIYTQWHVPFWQTALFFYVMIFGGVCLLSIVIWKIAYYFFHAKRVDPYWVVAHNEIKKLQNSDQLSIESASSFYAVLVMIIKTYLTEHYKNNFISKTDAECLELLHATEHDTQVSELMKHVLNGSLTVRFAREQSIKDIMQEDIYKAQQLIMFTQKIKQLQ